MKQFQALAEPWWVNLLLLVPVILAAWRKQGLRLKWNQLAFLAAFAVAFGLAKADVVIYLRAAVGMLPGYLGTLADVRGASYSYSYSQMRALHAIPRSLLKLETFREAATMAMLGGVALLSATKWRERCACFLWAFAIWDIVYYAGLRAVVHWPASLERAGRVIPNSRALGCTGVVPDSGERPHAGRDRKLESSARLPARGKPHGTQVIFTSR